MHEASLDVSPGKQSVEHNRTPSRRQLFSSPPCVKFKRKESEETHNKDGWQNERRKMKSLECLEK